MKEKDIFAKGIEQLKAEGFVPAQQMAVEATISDKNDWMSKMATKWKQVSEAVDSKSGSPMPEQHRAQSAPPNRKPAATMDIPAGLIGGSGLPTINESIDPREDDDYFERLQQHKLEQVRKNRQQPQQQYLSEIAHPNPNQQVQPQTIPQKHVNAPQGQGILNEQQVHQVAETVLKDIVLNLYIEEKIKKVLSEGLSNERIAQVVKQTIRELRDGAKKK